MVTFLPLIAVLPVFKVTLTLIAFLALPVTLTFAAFNVVAFLTTVILAVAIEDLYKLPSPKNAIVAYLVVAAAYLTDNVATPFASVLTPLILPSITIVTSLLVN